MNLSSVFLANFLHFDWIILGMCLGNFALYVLILKPTNCIHAHFVKSEQLGGLHQGAKQSILAHTAIDRPLTTTELMQGRKTMNKYYALYVNITTMFPLMGMLGTVYSLLPMVDTLGTSSTDAFFSALTSTFWGIIAALVFKLLDASLSYKIEDNEKYMEYLLKPAVWDEACP